MLPRRQPGPDGRSRLRGALGTAGLIGTRVRRREDLALITGEARFAADMLPGAATLAIARSPHPHARVRRTGLDAVRRLPGVLAAWDAACLPAASLVLPDPEVAGVDHHPRVVLAVDEARYQGEPVAIVVAETSEVAADAVEALEVDYDVLSPVHKLGGTLRLGFGDVEAALAAAPVRLRRRFTCARVTAAAIEPRAVAAEPAGTGLLMHTSTQWTFGVRDAVAGALDLPAEEVVVVAANVGGGFGGKGFPYPEEVLVAAAARALRRPVRWVASRSEETAASSQAHGIEFEVEVGAGSSGRLLAVRAAFRHDMGAYSAAAFAQAENLATHMLSLYRVPALLAEVELWFSSHAPARFVRGGARPLGNFAIERMLDFLADELGIDRLEIRRRNMLSDAELPYEPGISGAVIDGGGFVEMLETAAQAVSGTGGMGVAAAVESSGIGRPQAARAYLDPEGGILVLVGSTPHGQAHRTVFAQVAAERLGWQLESVTVSVGDTRLGGWSPQTAASRSAIEVGNAVSAAAARLRQRLLDLASERLEADRADIDLAPSGAAVRGAPGSRRPWSELAPAGLEVDEVFTPVRPRSWGANCHAARVQVDSETGKVCLLAHAVAHDAGIVINPAVVEGQVHGGLAHGIGYALFEELAYDGEARLRGATFLDYSIPGPPELAIAPSIVPFESHSTQNPEGFRGVGEAGTIPAPAAILSAIEAALRGLGVTIQLTELPVTPDRLLAAITGARGRMS
ncbi:MAG TPA: xanthine dehydrogenase family protein molybdopterin-binding subunit [Candidatus Dormibacteraeota bacterium]|nr:xanthine dehydrogenase family protein molybdopterin-binding subunit [Candidatus Dormibacteraeota bacterium]